MEAERGVLGAVLLNPNCIADVVEILRKNARQAFYDERHQAIYDAYMTMFRKNVPIDVVTLMDNLVHTGTLEAAGGVIYLSELSGAVPTSANVRNYATIVKDTALLRAFIDRQRGHILAAYEQSGSAQAILEAAEADMSKLATARVGAVIVPVKDFIDEVADKMFQQAEEHVAVTGVDTGFPKLNELTSGWQPGDMIVLAARPNVGKTGLALHFVKHCVRVPGKRALIFSLEMTKDSLMQRMICAEGDIDADALRRGKLNFYDKPKIRPAAARIKQWDIQIDDSPEGITEMTMRAKSRALAMKGGLDLIVIDYMQLVSPSETGGHTTRQEVVANISRAIKLLGRELRVPIIALSQLRRPQSGDHGAELHHLRESGAIEQDADVVIMVESEKSTKDDENDEGVDIIVLSIKKQRNGRRGKVRVRFNRFKQTFHEIVENAQEPPQTQRPAEYHRGYTADPDIHETYEEDDLPF